LLPNRKKAGAGSRLDQAGDLLVVAIEYGRQ
jgi:hypothetical protein